MNHRFSLWPREVSLLALALVSLLSLSPLSITPALAGPGHDHGDAPAAAAGPAVPRFAVTGEHFDLAGRLKGETLVLWLDRAADNAPVTTADIHVEMGAIKTLAKPAAEGTFEVALPGIGKLDQASIAFTVSAGKEADLLTADLVVHAPHPEPAGAGTHAHDDWRYWAAGGAALLVVFILAASFRRRNRGIPGEQA